MVCSVSDLGFIVFGKLINTLVQSYSVLCLLSYRKACGWTVRFVGWDCVLAGACVRKVWLDHVWCALVLAFLCFDGEFVCLIGSRQITVIEGKDAVHVLAG